MLSLPFRSPAWAAVRGVGPMMLHHRIALNPKLLQGSEFFHTSHTTTQCCVAGGDTGRA